MMETVMAYLQPTNKSNVRLSVLRRLIIETILVLPIVLSTGVIIGPSVGEVAKMIEGSMDIDAPPIPRNILELSRKAWNRCTSALIYSKLVPKGWSLVNASM
ncbi:hypothetical protein V6N13_035488 [Hibiscus sabdariffa]|uniref:Uncharacterized protein n=1 Tax=Hibiscus sabdariffa TaxID=183260 RepID=A0ABR2SA17_9ROSI